MENLRTYEKKVFDLKQLLEISRALNSTLDYYYLIQAVLDMCLAQAQTLKAGLFLTPDMDAEELLPASISKDFELPPQKSKFYQIDLNAEFIRYLKDEKEHAIDMEKMLKIFPKDPHLKIFQRLGVELIITMLSRGQILGLIFLGEKITGESYTEEECSFLSDLASLSSVAVTNARLYERATVDQMTGLKNHAYFQSVLRRECEKAKKRASSLSILFTDVDHFKGFNDTHGHQAGDEVLKSVAKVLRKCTRKNDLAARYGGEEFCIIMPGTEQKGALHIAERVRSSVEAMELSYKKSKLKITTSVGIALFDPKKDGKGTSALIERADKALYACKKNGRNQVQLYKASMA